MWDLEFVEWDVESGFRGVGFDLFSAGYCFQTHSIFSQGHEFNWSSVHFRVKIDLISLGGSEFDWFAVGFRAEIHSISLQGDGFDRLIVDYDVVIRRVDLQEDELFLGLERFIKCERQNWRGGSWVWWVKIRLKSN